MVCITLFPASNCILSVSSSRKEEREALEFLRSPENEVYKLCAMLFRVSRVLERYYKRPFLTQQCCVHKLTSSQRYNTINKKVSIFFIIYWEFTLDL